MATFGKTGIGAGSGVLLADSLRLTTGFVSVGGQVTSVSAYLETMSGIGVKGVIVNSALEIIANGVSTVTTPSDNAAQWVTMTYATLPVLQGGQTYYACVVANSGGGTMYFDTPATDISKRDNSNSYATPTNPTDGTNPGADYSIYATYTEIGPTVAWLRF